MCLGENGEAIQGKEMALRETAGEEKTVKCERNTLQEDLQYVNCGKQLEEATDVLSNCSAKKRASASPHKPMFLYKKHREFGEDCLTSCKKTVLPTVNHSQRLCRMKKQAGFPRTKRWYDR